MASDTCSRRCSVRSRNRILWTPLKSIFPALVRADLLSSPQARSKSLRTASRAATLLGVSSAELRANAGSARTTVLVANRASQTLISSAVRALWSDKLSAITPHSLRLTTTHTTRSRHCTWPSRRCIMPLSFLFYHRSRCKLASQPVCCGCSSGSRHARGAALSPASARKSLLHGIEIFTQRPRGRDVVPDGFRVPAGQHLDCLGTNYPSGKKSFIDLAARYCDVYQRLVRFQHIPSF